MNIPRCCRTCMWWDNTLMSPATMIDRPDEADPNVGVCQAEPPKMVEMAGGAVALFPMTHAGRFCAWWDPGDDDDGPPGAKPDPRNVVPFEKVAA